MSGRSLGAVALRHVILLFRVAGRAETTVDLMSTPLVDWLRAQDDATLAALVRLRPDLTVPPPADLTVLATRAGVRASVHRACDDLDTPTLAVMEALVVADADRRPSRGPRWLGCSAPTCPPTSSTPLWPPSAPARWCGSARGGRLVLGAPRSGPARDSAAGGRRRTARPGRPRRRARVPRRARPPGRGGGRVVGPAPGARRDRPGRATRARRPRRRSADRPQPRGRPERPGRAAAGQGAAAARRPGDRRAAPPGRARPARRPARSARSPSTRRRWTSATVAPTPSTGPRAAPHWTSCVVSRASSRSGAPPHRRCSAPVASACATSAGRRGRSTPTRPPPRSSSSSRQAPTSSPPPTASRPTGCPPRRRTSGSPVDPETRWSLLARTWLELPRLPGLVGRKDDAGKPINALSDGVRRPLAPRDRRRVLDGLAELPPGHAAATPAQLADVLAWRRTAPRRAAARRGRGLDARRGDDARAWSRWTRSPTRGARCSPRPTGSSPRCAPPCPPPIDHVLLQADLTAVAPGPLEAGLARELDLAADVESAGGATVYRFSERVDPPRARRRAAAPPTCTPVPTRSATPVPQGLTYLVDDVARRHGRLRGGAAAAFLRSDDEVLLSEVLAHPGRAHAGAAAHRPDGAGQRAPPRRADGGAAHGRVQPGRGGRRRARCWTCPTAAVAPRPAAAARASPAHPTSTTPRSPRSCRACTPGRPAGLRRGAEAFANGSTVDLLRSAVVEGRTVWVGFVDRHGVRGERVSRRSASGGGVVEGRGNDGAVLRLPLSHITSIALVDG